MCQYCLLFFSFLCLCCFVDGLLCSLLVFICVFLLCCLSVFLCGFVLFCKQKTAYDMRIIDWSSDVCSSDLILRSGARADRNEQGHSHRAAARHQISAAPRIYPPLHAIELQHRLSELVHRGVRRALQHDPLHGRRQLSRWRRAAVARRRARFPPRNSARASVRYQGVAERHPALSGLYVRLAALALSELSPRQAGAARRISEGAQQRRGKPDRREAHLRRLGPIAKGSAPVQARDRKSTRLTSSH